MLVIATATVSFCLLIIYVLFTVVKQDYWEGGAASEAGARTANSIGGGAGSGAAKIFRKPRREEGLDQHGRENGSAR